MINFRYVACGVVKNPGQDNEEKFLFVAGDDEEFEYLLPIDDSTSIKKIKNDSISYINNKEEFNQFLNEAFLYLCKELLKPKEETETL